MPSWIVRCERLRLTTEALAFAARSSSAALYRIWTQVPGVQRKPFATGVDGWGHWFVAI